MRISLLFFIISNMHTHALVRLGVALALVATQVTPVAYAQSPAPDAADQAAVKASLDEYFASRNQCLEQYKFGSVSFTIDASSSGQQYQAGRTATVRGTIQNNNEYPLPDGKVYAHVLLQDQTVAAEQWHPLVTDATLPGTYSLPANGTVPFTFSWNIPQNAPEGTYRVELYYLAGGRYVMAGLPYTPNVAGGSAVFRVAQSQAISYPEFDRSSVTLQGKPLALRSVPPVTATGQPITIAANLSAKGSAAIPVTIKTELYDWSITDGKDPIISTSSVATISQTKPVSVPLVWDNPTAGAYEVVLTATPDDKTLIPTMLKFRFPIAGNDPRIIYSGIGAIENNEAVITTCVVNSTFGEGTGEISTTVQGNSNNVIGQTKGATDALSLSSTVLRVPIADLAAGSTVTTNVKNEAGQVTDQHTIAYSSELLLGTAPQPEETVTTPDTPRKSNSMAVVIALVLLLLVLVGGIAAVMYIQRKSSNNPTNNL